MVSARATKWWGWGFEDRGESIDSRPALRAFLGAALELPDRVDSLLARDPASIPLPPPRLRESDVAALRGFVGDAASRAAMDRLSHALGKSYRDLLRLRLGDVPSAPDIVLFPGAEEHLSRVLAWCSDGDVGVVPFGGGTSVVGGVEVADGSRPHVTLDLRRMNRVLGVDTVSLTVTAEAGILGPDLEARLAAARLTAGHFPQSFEFSTLGGWVATRSTGALSGRYGKIEDMVAGLRLVAPSGLLDLRGRPRHAMGPDLLSLAVGSEGTFGVISRATIRVHPAPAARRFATVLFRSFGEGLDVLRAMAQDGVPPDMAYLDDEDETRLSLAGARGERGIGRTSPQTPGVPRDRGSLCYFAFEGAQRVVERRLALGRAYFGRGASLGPRPAKAWFDNRFAAPYVRDALIERRIMVDTVETATMWSNVERLHGAACDALRDAIAAAGFPGFVGCHVSHVYSEGASLYFTFLSRQKRGEELAQYDAVKSAVTRAILDHGGHLSHHHGIGTEHAKYLREAIGEDAWRLLRELKRTLDPRGIMNPGKIFPVGS